MARWAMCDQNFSIPFESSMNVVEDRWDGAIIQDITCDTRIQIAGIQDLDGHTCFVRLHGSNRNKIVTLNMVVCEVQNIFHKLHSHSSSRSDHQGKKSHVDLIRIGAVWILPNDNRNRPRRADVADTTMDISNYIIRIHHGAKRFWSAYNYQWGVICGNKTNDTLNNGVILYEDVSLGFAVINKPSGVPVHGYVYNSVENVIHMYQTALRERYPNDSYQFCVSAPQRLDNDTSGVLVLAIKSSFASFMGKLFEDKTLAHIEKGKQTEHEPTAISKKYKVLVCMESIDRVKYLQNLANKNKVVTHYLSPERSERRIFKITSDDIRNDQNWLECHLKVISVGFNSSKLYLPVERLEGTPTQGEGGFVSKSKKYTAVTEVEVELLTGRTHQIRGQMSALGFPLVGDLIYGGVVTARDQSKIALHCSQITFPKPLLVNESSSFRKKKGRSKLCPSTSDSFTFHSSHAWWDEYVNI